jgi:prophage DNA circulation protein
MASDTVVRQAVTDTGTAMQTAAAAVSDPTAFCTSSQAFVQAVAESASDPADAIRMLMSMVTYAPTGNTSNSQIGVAIATMQTQCGNVFRRTVLASLAQACATYQPASQQDAQTLSTQVAGAIDAEIEIAGDAGDDASYTAMRTLRQAVITDLQSRSAGLAAVATFNFPTSLPALTLANRIYRDATRADGLVQQANPIHPAFLPVSFEALAT